MTFGLQTAKNIAGAPINLIGGLGKKLLNILPFSKGKKGAEAKRKDVEEISRSRNLPDLSIKFSFDIPKELGKDANNVIANFPGLDDFKSQVIDGLDENYANLNVVHAKNGLQFEVNLKENIKEPALRINGKGMDVPKIMKAFNKAKGNPEHKDFFFTNFMKVLKNGKSVEAFVQEVEKFKPGEKAAKEKPKAKNEVKKTDRKLKRDKSDRDYLDSIYDDYSTERKDKKSVQMSLNKLVEAQVSTMKTISNLKNNSLKQSFFNMIKPDILRAQDEILTDKIVNLFSQAEGLKDKKEDISREVGGLISKVTHGAANYKKEESSDGGGSTASIVSTEGKELARMTDNSIKINDENKEIIYTEVDNDVNTDITRDEVKLSE